MRRRRGLFRRLAYRSQLTRSFPTFLHPPARPPPRAGDYEREGTPAAAASVEGYIAPPGGAPVRPFRLDAALPPVKLADALWAAVGEAHGLSS